MTLSLAVDSNQSLSSQLDHVFAEVDARLVRESPDLAAVCRDLLPRTRRLVAAAKNYDFRDVEANGFWTFARLVLRFGHVVCVSPEHHLRAHLLPVAKVLSAGLDLCDQFLASSSDDLFGTPPQHFPQLLRVFGDLQPHLDIVYGVYSSFWLCPSMRRVVNGFTALMAVYSGGEKQSWIHSSRTLFDQTLRAQTVAHIAQNASVQFVKSFWGLTETPFVRNTLPLLSPPLNCAAKDLFVPSQTTWTISATDASVARTKDRQTLPDIRCRLLQSRAPDAATDAIVLHLHGGGFVAQSPDSHEVYLGQWAVKLSQTAILSVDYALSPENKYPTALQQILDVYLWLASDACVPALGYRPRRVVVCGDSAGGNLSLALCLVVHDICREGEPLLRPKGVVCFYTPFMLQTRGSPSRLMTAVDTLLPLGVLLSCLEAYAPDADIDCVDADFELISHDEIPADEELPQMTSQNLQLVNRFARLRHKLSPSASTSPPKPWYRCPETPLAAKLLSLNAATNNAYVSPLMAANLDFHDIPLYLVALVYDACLDDSIQMAKKWNGPVCLDVVDGLPHGFLNFVLVSEDAKRAADLCLDRVQQALT
ncbi:unnamed protein product [Oppiella nova]|uniref:Hormone-sensitive lipase n=1 Tax=Oppiella nova TaxID=334625 RepID=A0A7R9LHP8_9ACAR|nr:unnamed protein product [Oppiella nova]CAG2163652.1 unnamed protein product [Oppiella nova]